MYKFRIKFQGDTEYSYRHVNKQWMLLCTYVDIAFLVTEKIKTTNFYKKRIY